MFNSLQLIGHLGGDPEARYFESGSQVTRFTIYLNERYKKDDEAKERTHRFSVECWGKTAEFATNYLHKGSRVAINGSLTENRWSDPDGQNHSRVIVRADRIENLTPKKPGEPPAAEDTGYDPETF